jgi:cardiolipin synthase
VDPGGSRRSSESAGGLRARDAIRVPGLLSLCRAPLAAAFPLVFRSPVHAIAVLAAAGLSDILDGWYARRFHQETPTGAALDGVMDKLFALSVLATLVLSRTLSLFEAFILSAREIGEALLLGVALLVRPRRADSARSANGLGKLATVLQFTSIIVVILDRGPRSLCVYATGTCGALAAIAYGLREFDRGTTP